MPFYFRLRFGPLGTAIGPDAGAGVAGASLVAERAEHRLAARVCRVRWLKRRLRIRRWGRVVWEEPGLPPYVKINPEGVNPDPGELQPGDISMAKAAEEFLDEPEE